MEPIQSATGDAGSAPKKQEKSCGVAGSWVAWYVL